MDFRNIEIYKNDMLLRCPIFSYLFKSSSVYLNPYIRGPTGPKNPEIMKFEVFGLSSNSIGKLLVQSEAE